MENVPVVLGQYRLGKTLGIGAFGKVKCNTLNFNNVQYIFLIYFVQWVNI